MSKPDENTFSKSNLFITAKKENLPQCILNRRQAILVSRDFHIASPEILGGDHSCRSLKTTSNKNSKISKTNSKNSKTKAKSKTDNTFL
ncbi:MAG TPA: hypothetical protein DF364_07980 [Ruminococcaceae bacterium]|nr:hypothetical protein [Oscillospiraceae bacterium]HCU33766.1 hypothetical protein [Oscillospiraceae bacterium]